MNVHRTLRQLNLHGAIVEIQERDARLAADANGRAADVQFAAGISVGPEIVARRERAVGIRLHPIRFAARLEGNRSLNVVEARHSSRADRRPPVRATKTQREIPQEESELEQEENSFSHSCLCLRHAQSRELGFYFDSTPRSYDRVCGIANLLHTSRVVRHAESVSPTPPESFREDRRPLSEPPDGE